MLPVNRPTIPLVLRGEGLPHTPLPFWSSFDTSGLAFLTRLAPEWCSVGGMRIARRSARLNESAADRISYFRSRAVYPER